MMFIKNWHVNNSFLIANISAKHLHDQVLFNLINNKLAGKYLFYITCELITITHENMDEMDKLES